MFVYRRSGNKNDVAITVYEEDYHVGNFIEKISIIYNYTHAERVFRIMLSGKNGSGYSFVLSLRRLLGWLLINDHGMSLLESFKFVVHIMHVFHTINNRKLLIACIENFGL